MKLPRFYSSAASLFLVSLLISYGTIAFFPETWAITRQNDVIWAENSTGCSGAVVSIPVMIENSDTEVAAFGFDLHYCPDMLEFVSCTNGQLTAGWYFLECNEWEAGIVRAGGFSMTPIPTGSNGSIVVLRFSVTCENCDLYDECITNMTNLEDDLIGWTTLPGTFTYYCDPTFTPTATRSPTPTPTPTHTPLSDVIQVENSSGCFDEMIEIPVNVSNPNSSLVSFGFELSYSTDMLEYKSCAAGNLTAGWPYLDCNEITPGTIVAGGFGETPIPPGNNGSIVILQFNIICETCENDDLSSLTLSDLVDDVTDWVPLPGTFTYYCAPTPTFTPSPPPTYTPIPTDDYLWADEISGYAGEALQAAVSISNPDTPLSSFGFELNYDPDMLNFLSCDPGLLTADWPYLNCNQITPGHIIIGGFNSEPLPAGQSDSIILLNFQVVCESCFHGDQCPLAFDDMVDDIAHWDAQNGKFTFLQVFTVPAFSIFGALSALFFLSRALRKKVGG